jgi:hypothetical protein
MSQHIALVMYPAGFHSCVVDVINGNGSHQEIILTGKDS